MRYTASEFILDIACTKAGFMVSRWVGGAASSMGCAHWEVPCQESVAYPAAGGSSVNQNRDCCDAHAPRPPVLRMRGVCGGRRVSAQRRVALF